MQKLTFRARISLGFASVLAVLLTVCALGAWRMSSSATAADRIAGAKLPLANAATEANSAYADLQLALRTYSFTNAADQRELALKLRTETKQAIDTLNQVATAHPELSAKLPSIQQAANGFAEYSQLMDATIKSTGEVEQRRGDLSQSAEIVRTALEEMLAGQLRKQADEIKAQADSETLRLRALRISEIVALRQNVDAVRIINFRAQALRDTTLFEPANEAFAAIDTIAGRLRPLLRDPRDLQDLERVVTAKAKYQTDFNHLRDAMVAIGELGKRRLVIATAVEKTLTQLKDEANREASLGSSESAAALTQSSRLAQVGLVVGALLGIGIATWIIISLSRILTGLTITLAAGADQTAAAAGQVSASSQSLAEGASEQAASLEETSASLEEMASMTKRNADSAHEAKQIAADTRHAADACASDMQQMQQAMDAIQGSSGEIAKIVKTIDDIAFQTNILALNAAVEAARAGEAGAGFAVVAEEVRALAQRSAAAAKETGAKIEASVAKSAHGVQISAKVAGSLQQIVERARRVDTIVAAIAQASQEQTQGIGQVNTAVSQMDKVTQSNASSAEECAAAAEELNAQAAELQRVVAELNALVGTDTTAAAPAAAAPQVRPAAPVRTAIQSPSAPAPRATRAAPRHPQLVTAGSANDDQFFTNP
jgi:methyl-accepting chemotaxis protein